MYRPLYDAHRLPQNRLIGMLGWRVVGAEPPTHVPATIWKVLDRLKVSSHSMGPSLFFGLWHPRGMLRHC
jgi:hypothetical protein